MVVVIIIITTYMEERLSLLCGLIHQRRPVGLAYNVSSPKGGSVAYRWQTSGLLLAATYCAQLFVAYRAIVSIIQLNAWLVNIC